ncbi:MAG: phenylalanine--tRNA ligase subunit beta [bacterium]|nr:phenylalanine--tRNA ligase subunit beta [bacterium]
MLISLNWLRDFVDLPGDVDPHALAERFTMVCAEVEGLERIAVGAEGLIAAGILECRSLPGTSNLSHVVLDVGDGRKLETVTAAPALAAGQSVVYAPPGARVAALPDIGEATVAGHSSAGMILPGDALGIALAAQEAVFLDPNSPQGQPGTELPAEAFDDWVIEVDNKSITHRPDLWGHYGIAREIAAVYQTPLKPYPVTPLEELTDLDLPELPIEIDDPKMCPRYTGLVMRALDPRPAPLWMQLRLGHVGLRPIDCMVDLTNYIMFELGQPMHAFDGDSVDRIEVGLLEPGAKFTTLDGVERTLPADALMILSNRKPVALAGIMGGANTEIGPQTKSVLLESANFNAAVIRRAAVAMGHRTDASTRFEKSLDPVNTVRSIQRFVYLARDVWPQMTFATRLSDGYPEPAQPIGVDLDPAFAAKFMGHPIDREQIRSILTPLEFTVEEAGDKLRIGVPGFRATKDVSIEADIIEEIARCVGYDNIEPCLPEMTIRSYPPNTIHELEQDTLRQWTSGMGYSEIHGYLWYDAEWNKRLSYAPSDRVTLRNPIAAGAEQLRHTLMPNLLAALDKNRHHLAEFKLVEIGTAVLAAKPEDLQTRHLAVLSAARRKGQEDALLAELRGAIETWAWQTLSRPTAFLRADVDGTRPWQHPQKTAAVMIGEVDCGRVSVVPVKLRRAIDDHLAPWSAVWAEIDLTALLTLDYTIAQLEDIPEYPQKELDFTAVVDAARSYQEVGRELARFEHPLLRRLSYVTSYEGKSVGPGRRSLTYRAHVGSDKRTLIEEDLLAFSKAFGDHLTACGLELRT